MSDATESLAPGTTVSADAPAAAGGESKPVEGMSDAELRADAVDFLDTLDADGDADKADEKVKAEDEGEPEESTEDGEDEGEGEDDEGEEGDETEPEQAKKKSSYRAMKERLESEVKAREEEVQTVRAEAEDLRGTLREGMVVVAEQEEEITSLRSYVSSLEATIQQMGVRVDPRDLELAQYRAREAASRRGEELRTQFQQNDHQRQTQLEARRQAEAEVGQVVMASRARGFDKAGTRQVLQAWNILRVDNPAATVDQAADWVASLRNPASARMAQSSAVERQIQVNQGAPRVQSAKRESAAAASFPDTTDGGVALLEHLGFWEPG